MAIGNLRSAPGGAGRCFRARAALLILLPVVGCESKSPPQSAQDGGARVVTVWAHHGRPDEHEAMQRIVREFNNAHRGDIHVEIEFFPDRQYPDKVSVAAFSDALPDVLDIDGPFVGPWAADDLLLPLDEFVDDALRADMLPSLIEQGTYNGKLWALGAFDSALVVYYNRDILAKIDLEPPGELDKAWTWDEFTAALEKVKPHCTIPLSLHMDDQSDEWFTYAFAPLVWSNGGALIDTKQHQATGAINGPRAIDAIERWKGLFTAGFAEATTTNPDPFSDGLAAFDWTGHWMLPVFEQATELRFGVMPLPRVGYQVVVPAGSWCWGISSACEEPTAAWTVIAWFLHPEHGIKPIVSANGAVPGRRSAFELFPAYEEMPRRLFRAQLIQAARARPRTPVYLTLTSEFAGALRDIALGGDVRTALDKAANNVQRALDRR